MIFSPTKFCVHKRRVDLFFFIQTVINVNQIPSETKDVPSLLLGSCSKVSFRPHAINCFANANSLYMRNLHSGLQVFKKMS